MINTIRSTRGMAVTPHALASQAALGVLKDGGDAIEAMVAAASTIAVVYPHMNGIGGDGFWVIHAPGEPVQAIDACGAAASTLSRNFYLEQGMERIPTRGPLAANTVAGTVSGWDLALDMSKRKWGGRLPLSRLFQDALHYAENGMPVTASQCRSTTSKMEELRSQPGFAGQFLMDGLAPPAGAVFPQQRVAATLRQLQERGLDDFYRGELAEAIASDLSTLGSPLRVDDLRNHRAMLRKPLALEHSRGSLFNMPPPTQGLVSLAILGILDRLDLESVTADSADYIHLVVEATKLAFSLRDNYITDPAYMRVDPQGLLARASLDILAAEIHRNEALPWGSGRGPGDTVWMGVIDGQGRAVSFIQSIYHEFGSGIVLPSTGINWQNRGCSFSLDAGNLNALEPGRKPFHTLNPALALLNDGRTMVYGTMGGDGQPQTQAALFTRTIVYGQDLQEAISAPRWLLGRTWGQMSDSLKLEARFGPTVVSRLREMGHTVEVIGDFDESVGHAGAILLDAAGVFAGGADPRSDGSVAAF